VLLTAGHCVAARDANGEIQTNDITFVRFEDNALEGIQNYPANLAGWHAVERVVPHPEWTDYSQFPITYDIGVVILAEPYDAGVTGTLPPTAQDDYEKYKGTGGGTCYGDSGGPAFFKDTQMVVAVTSFGWAKNGNCIGTSFFYRTDIAASQDFLDEVLEMYGD
jgi:V8-like Glu-specific endopeptidase